jgi:hypothetical protein
LAQLAHLNHILTYDRFNGGLCYVFKRAPNQW